MLWVPQERKTHSSTVFALFWPLHVTTLTSGTFDFAPLLSESVAREAAADDDVEDLHANAEDRETTPIDDFNDIDQHNPPSFESPHPPKRVKRAPSLDDIPKRNHHRHTKRRDRHNAAIHANGHAPRPATLRNHVHQDRAIPTNLDASALPATHGAYAMQVEDPKSKYGAKKRHTVAELLGLGFRLVKWDGVEARPIADCKGRIIAVLAGQPNDPTYARAVSAAFQAMLLGRAEARFPASVSKPSRGPFPALNAGLSYSKGQCVPSRLGGPYTWLLQRLLGNSDVSRITFASASYCLWAPKAYEYYKDHDDALHRHPPLSHLGRNFPKSVFSCTAFNFGPNAWTYRHRDVLNVPFGWCAVTAMGDFNPSIGGHLVLWDLKMVVEFPHAATILLPSATIAHSNVPVAEGKARGSFTQYTPGALMCYVDNRFRTEAELQEEDPEEYVWLCALKEMRWEMGIGLLSTVEELLECI